MKLQVDVVGWIERVVFDVVTFDLTYGNTYSYPNIHYIITHECLLRMSLNEVSSFITPPNSNDDGYRLNQKLNSSQVFRLLTRPRSLPTGYFAVERVKSKIYKWIYETNFTVNKVYRFLTDNNARIEVITMNADYRNAKIRDVNRINNLRDTTIRRGVTHLANVNPKAIDDYVNNGMAILRTVRRSLTKS